MARPKSNGADRNTIIGIFQYFGAQDQKITSAWKKAAGIKTSDMKAAAQAGCLPVQGRWKKIVTSATANGWTAPTQTKS